MSHTVYVDLERTYGEILDGNSHTVDPIARQKWWPTCPYGLLSLSLFLSDVGVDPNNARNSAGLTPLHHLS
jgi:hypothetical protein